MMYRILLFLLFYSCSFSARSQCNWIYIEHLGAADSGFPDICVIDGYYCEDSFLVQHDSLFFMSNTITNGKSFDKLAKIFYSLDEKKITEGDSRWANFRISKYDGLDSLIYRRYICCNDVSIAYFKLQMGKRKIRKDVELSSLFKLLIAFLEPEKNNSDNKE